MTGKKEITIVVLCLFVMLICTLKYEKKEEVISTIIQNDLEDVLSGRGSGAHDNFHALPNIDDIPILGKEDLIYKFTRKTVPVVNEEYNLVFFLVAKAASSEWLRFLMRLQGNENWCSKGCIHERGKNGLKYLSDYSLEDAQEMMTSSKWTRAIFVRNPKPRILSAFLDKAVSHSRHFKQSNCPIFESRGGSYDVCIKKHQEFDFFLYNITTHLGQNVHWRSIYSRVDEKWWPWINYVANMEDLSGDAEHFLRSIKSNVDGVSAWDRHGKTGWSDNERDCDSLGDSAFLAKKDTRHKTNAKDKMRQYYTAKLERFVETHYADDFNNPFFKFNEVRLFEEEDGENL